MFKIVVPWGGFGGDEAETAVKILRKAQGIMPVGKKSGNKGRQVMIKGEKLTKRGSKRFRAVP